LAQVTLTPAEGKRLIGKGIAAMEPVQSALRQGTLIIATSTTTGYVVEELLGQEIDKAHFTAGVVTADGCHITGGENRYDHYVLRKGELTTMKTPELPPILERMGPDDVFIKGANAIDCSGAAGILLAGINGGTIGTAWGYLTANGVKTIIAAGLEKLVPTNLADVARRTGRNKVDKSMGWACGMMVVHADIVTEVEAFQLLFEIEAIPIAGGGISGGEGARVFLLEGDTEQTEAAFDLVMQIKGEPRLECKTVPTGQPVSG
jgi:hypothetical protein